MKLSRAYLYIALLFIFCSVVSAFFLVSMTTSFLMVSFAMLLAFFVVRIFEIIEEKNKEIMSKKEHYDKLFRKKYGRKGYT